MKKRLILKLLLSSFVFAYTLISKPVNDFVFVRAELDWADPSSSQYEKTGHIAIIKVTTPIMKV